MPTDTLTGLSIRSPKLRDRGDRWYRYYAGYERTFVDDLVAGLYNDRSSLDVLDPWMGSGTTLSAAAARGHHVHGLDLNPAMIVVAKGRLLAEDTIASIAALTREIVKRWKPAEPTSDDPLTQWFDRPSAASVRGGQKAVDALLSEPSMSVDQMVIGMSSLAAFFTVALFECVGSCLRSYASHNPTWIKRSGLGEGQLSVDLASLTTLFTTSVERLVKHLVDNGAVDKATRDHATINLGDSRNLELEDKSISSTITSPPYLTRLDYVIGHLPELAVLGVGPSEVVELRRKMIGTPTMGSAASSRALGSVTEDLLTTISAHGSYAAKSYYAPNFRQYFEGIADSLSEISRVSRDDGDLLVVVQDSWFKGVHLDLARCIADLASQHHWSEVGKMEFVGIHSMVMVNPHATPEAKKNKPVESLIHFRRTA